MVLAPKEALDLLAGNCLGRIVFTREALPAVRVVNHILDAGHIIIRTRLNSRGTIVSPTRTPPAVVVAYQSDSIDIATRRGWSVVVTGLASTVTDPGLVARYEQLLHPWINLPMDTVISITPEIVTGICVTG